MSIRISTRWYIALSFLFYLIGNLALTLFVSPSGISGLLFLFPLYAVTWFWGRRTGLVAAALGVGMNIAIWLAAGDGMLAIHRFSALGITVLYIVAALAHVVFVLVVSTLRGREDQSRSEIQRSTELLRLSENKYRSLVEVAPEGVWVVENGKVIFCNTHFLEILGYSRDEMIGMPVQTINFREDLQSSMERYAARAEGQLLPKSVTRQVRKNGKVIWVETSGQRIEWEGRSAVLYFSSDVSERKAFEEQFAQAQKMEAIGRLSGGIAHDFNNILQVILGFCTMMKSYPDDRNAILNDLGTIEDSAKRAASLTQQLLAFSRKQVVQPKVIDLGELVQQSEKVLCRVLGEDVALTVVLGGEEACVRADAAQIQQVTMNLALNARDAMPDGGRITISVENERVQESRGHDIPPGDYVRLTVSDNGRGMDPYTLGHLFEPFFTTKGLGKGTGLGLSIVYGLVRQSGGHIRVESTIGAGSTFIIYLPRIFEPTDDSKAREEEHGQSGSASILLVEDESAVRALVSRILNRGGYTVTEAANGEEAIEACRSRKEGFHLLITDIVLTGMRGTDVADSVRGFFPKTHVIFMTGYVDKGDVPQQEDVPILRKPFSATELLTQVKNAMAAAPDRSIFPT